MEPPQASVQEKKEPLSDQEQAKKLYDSGLKLLESKKRCPDKVIKCLQKAIALDDSKYTYWLLLGEAYYLRGSRNPAVNCFVKALFLADFDASTTDEELKKKQADCTHARLRMSDIRFSAGQLEEAAIGYQEIIVREPCNVDALLGLSRTELELCKRDFSSSIVISGHKHCMEALKLSIRATKLNSRLLSGWTLALDCCLTQLIHGQRGDFTTDIKETIPDLDGKASSVMDKKSCIELTLQLLCKSIAIEDPTKSSHLWHKLGICLFLKSSLYKEGSIDSTTLLKKSVKCLLKALSLDRNSSQIKNSLGVVSFHLNLLSTSQSFLIKSIQANQTTSEIQFSNLGFILLSKQDYNKAGSVFVRSQAEEPRFSQSWLGAAIINEHIGSDNSLYLRHCHRLGNNYDAQLMFATKAASLSLSGDKKRDLISALDCMKKIINYDDQSTIALNTLGLVLESSGDQKQAKDYFEAAYKISPQEPKIIFNKLRHHLADKSCCLIGADFQQNIEYNFIQDAERLANSGERGYMVNFLYYLFKNEDFRDLTSKLTKFIDKSLRHDVHDKASAQTILSLVAKQDRKNFKDLLLKNVIELQGSKSIEIVVNLSCLMVLAAGAKEQKLVENHSTQLSESILKFISSTLIGFDQVFQSREGFWIRLSLFSSLFCLQDRGKLLRPLIALFPMVAELWLFMAFSSILGGAKSNITTYCIERATLIGSTKANIGLICDLLLLNIVDSEKRRKQLLSRAIYKHPDEKLLWDLLLDKRQQPIVNDPRIFDLAVDILLNKVIS